MILESFLEKTTEALKTIPNVKSKKVKETWFLDSNIFVSKIQHDFSDISRKAAKGYVFEQCYGCSIDHPSQTHHPCIMESPLTHLMMYFEMTLEKVNKVSLMNKWQKEMGE